jgi:hypothetical protein
MQDNRTNLLRRNFPLSVGGVLLDQSHVSLRARRYQIVMFDDDTVTLRRLVPTWYRSRCTFVPAHQSDLGGEDPYRTLSVGEFYQEFHS